MIVIGSLSTFGSHPEAHWYATVRDPSGRTIANLEHALTTEEAAALNAVDGDSGFTWKAGYHTERFFTAAAAASALIDYADKQGLDLLNRIDIEAAAT